MSEDFAAVPEDGPAASEYQNLLVQVSAQAELIEAQQRQLNRSFKIFRLASEAARIGVWQCDLSDMTVQWSDVIYDIFELPRDSELKADEIFEYYRDDSGRLIEQLGRSAIMDCSGFRCDAPIVTAKGNERWVRITATVECEAGKPVRILGMKQDITDEKIVADQMKYLAECDVLTDLANRARFQQELTQREASADGGVLLLIDIDDFKSINDSFGHPAGDECLRQMAARFRAVCGSVDLIARIGGDEFAILLGPGLELASVQHLARQLIEQLSRPIRFGRHQLQSTVSLGIARLTRSTAAELYANADAALYAAKKAGRNTFRIHQATASGQLLIMPVFDTSPALTERDVPTRVARLK